MSSDPLIGSRVGNYRIEALLGEGGMAQVYRATHPVIGGYVAVKVLSAQVAALPDVVRRFQTEAQAVKRLEHPHIIQIFDFGALDDGRPFYLMELLTGESLAQHIRRVGAMTVHDALGVIDPVLDVLDVVHRANIVHRDLKPDNVFLARAAGRTIVKVLDFGIAKILDDGALDKTRTGALLGTPSYMAPEQCEGRQRDIGPWTDLYAVGCMLYQMLSGQLPFDAESLGGLLLQHMTQPPPRLVERIRNVPAPISDLVASCLAKDASYRPASAASLRAQLRPYLAPPGVEVLATVIAPQSAATVLASHGPAAAPVPVPVPAPVPVPVPAPVPVPVSVPAPVPVPESLPPGPLTLPMSSIPVPRPPQPPQPQPSPQPRSRTPLAVAAALVVIAAAIAIIAVVHHGHGHPAAAPSPADAARRDAPPPDARPPDASRPDAPSPADARPIDAPHDGPLTLKERLEALEHMCADGIWTPEECAAKRREILDEFGH